MVRVPACDECDEAATKVQLPATGAANHLLAPKRLHGRSERLRGHAKMHDRTGTIIPKFASAEALKLWLSDLHATQSDPQMLLSHTAQALGEYLGASRVIYGEFQLAAETLHIPLDWTRKGVTSLAGRHPIFLESAMIRAYATGATLIADDSYQVESLGEERAFLEATGTRAFVTVPLLGENGLHAIFSVNDDKVRHWSAEDVSLIEYTAARTRAMLDHLRLIEKLRESEEQFRHLAENLPGLCWIGDDKGQLFWANQQWHDMFDGTSAAQGDLSGVMHPEDLRQTLELWDKMRHSGEMAAAHLRMRGRDGIYRPYISRAVPIRDTNGAVVRWCGVQIDLSDKHAHDRRQAVLRAFHDRSRELTDRAAILGVLAQLLVEYMGIPHFLYGDTTDGIPETLDAFHAHDGVEQAHPAIRFSLITAFRTLAASYSWAESRIVDDNRTLGRPADDPVQRAADLMGVRSSINVPIVREGKPVAMIALLDTVTRRWTEDEIELAEELAERVWAALARARAESALQERERHQAFVIDWSDRVRGETSPSAIMTVTLDWLGRHLSVTRATYSESDASGRLFSILGEWREPEVVSIADTQFSLDDVGETVEREWIAGAIVRYDDVASDPRVGAEYVPAYLAAQIQAFVSIPLIENGRVRSALSVQHKEVRHWRDSEIQLLRDIAERSWVSLERARAQAELAERERHQAFLIDWSDRIRGETSPEAIMGTTLQWLANHLGATRTTYAECDMTGRRFTVTGEWRDGAVSSIRGNSFFLENVGAAVDRDWSVGEIIRYDDVASDDRLEQLAQERYRDAQIAAFVSVPLVQRGAMRSALSIQQSSPRVWHESEIQLMRDIAERTWVALERARVQTALQERERNQTFLIAWSDKVRRETSPQAIIATTLEWLGQHLGITRATYSESDAEGRVFTVAGEWRNGVNSNLGARITLGSISASVDKEWVSGDLVCYDDVIGDPRVDAAAAERYAATSIRAFISVPLVQDGQMRSILSVHDKNPRHWQPGELQLMRDIAERAWVTLERAQAEAALQERERNQAFLIAWNDRINARTNAREILGETLAALGEHLGLMRTNFAETTNRGQELCVLQEWTDGVLSATNERYPLAVLGAKLAESHSSGLPVRVDDTAHDPRFDETNKPLFDRLSIHAVLTLPMMRGGEIVGVLSVQSSTPRRWSDGEVDLVRELADRTLAVLERAHSEERLAESEAQLSAFLENAPVAMHLKDADGRYVRVNPEFARGVGRMREEVQGANADEVFPPRIAAEVKRLEALALAGEVASAEVAIGEILGDDSYVLSMVFPITGAGVARTGGFTLDLTERKRAEAALARSRETLYQTEKLSALGSLLAGVSHELNNPLSIVVAQAVMMERQSQGGELAERAQKIRKAADRCARIVQTFLAMARQKRPEREPVNLNAVAMAAYDLAEYGLRTDGIVAKRELAVTLPTISADSDQLHQIIINLLVNAQQAMGDTAKSERKLTLRTAEGETAGTVILDVIDNGPGVPDDMRRRIFEPFYTTKPQGEGTGVGLSFSQGLAEAHGGKLELLPAERGAHFRLTLPVDPAQGAPELQAPARVSTEGPARRALVVDDELEIAESLADFLSIEGFTCDVAVGGVQAQKRLLRGQYDLIVSDLRMPGMDGPQLHAWLKDIRPDLEGRMAFATGDTLGANAARFLEAMDRPVLEKPFMPDAVHRFLQQMDLA
ncbi:MAG: GAF domain-containing protein [Sphingomonadales bacterium]|nr:MAG: GAF domain-containing protein [Sphingomonadales bacterium]